MGTLIQILPPHSNRFTARVTHSNSRDFCL